MFGVYLHGKSPHTMDGILNEYTNTVHKHETGTADLHTPCGVTHNINPDQLRAISVHQATTEYDANKCGRCFEDGGGY